ncbi:hypothetical protein EV385_0592 [Krasilnikovia cinnamomea]|uniref:Uncharacterized protein n=1 Tax=Krasilnikovia cinnamomea TaxID=349313 RepID=A0A4Q7ZFF9_9ACTN|nr:hypothetical protein [Krasilnikovia cinnamomea]RZU48863.1 hypothetical protein EV385_0592 [Krasilnikovia cinnamomea]
MGRHARGAHTGWCAADHRCNLTEHRSDDLVVTLPGFGRAVLTRVRDERGREYGELRARIALDGDEYTARVQLRTALTDLRALLSRAAEYTRRAA